MITHELKCTPEFFSAIKSGKKNFELRYNDRGYKVGEVLLLREYNPMSTTYTGRLVYRQIMYVLDSFPDGLKPYYVVLALAKVSKKRVETS